MIIELHCKPLKNAFKRDAEQQNEMVAALEEAAMQITRNVITDLCWFNYHKIILHLNEKSSPVRDQWSHKQTIAFCASIVSGMFHGYIGAEEAWPFSAEIYPCNSVHVFKKFLLKGISQTESSVLCALAKKQFGTHGRYTHGRYNRDQFRRELLGAGIDPDKMHFTYRKGALIVSEGPEIECFAGQDPVKLLDAWMVNHV